MSEHGEATEYVGTWPSQWVDRMHRLANVYRLNVVLSWYPDGWRVKVEPRDAVATPSDREWQAKCMHKWEQAAVEQELIPPDMFVGKLPPPGWWECCSLEELQTQIQAKLADQRPEEWRALWLYARDRVPYKEINRQLDEDQIAQRTLSRVQKRLRCEDRAQLGALIRYAIKHGVWPGSDGS